MKIIIGIIKLQNFKQNLGTMDLPLKILYVHIRSTVRNIDKFP
jgi:hypothetical protein